MAGHVIIQNAVAEGIAILSKSVMLVVLLFKNININALSSSKGNVI